MILFKITHRGLRGESCLRINRFEGSFPERYLLSVYSGNTLTTNFWWRLQPLAQRVDGAHQVVAPAAPMHSFPSRNYCTVCVRFTNTCGLLLLSITDTKESAHYREDEASKG